MTTVERLDCLYGEDATLKCSGRKVQWKTERLRFSSLPESEKSEQSLRFDWRQKGVPFSFGCRWGAHPHRQALALRLEELRRLLRWDPSRLLLPVSAMRASTSLYLFAFCAFFFVAQSEDPAPQPAVPEPPSQPATAATDVTSHDAAEPLLDLKQQTAPGPHPADGTHPGLSALEQARSEANSTVQMQGPGLVSMEGSMGDNASDMTAGESGSDPARSAHGNGSAPSIVAPVVRCADGTCVELGAALLSAVEGESCRSLFVNGKCPAVCGQGIAAVTGNESWAGCATACGNDVVTGAAERWAELCEVRQETLIDQGKEVVKGLVGDGLSSRLHWRAVLQFFLAVMILVVGVGYGYRRGAVSAQHAYRLQKRRLLGRKNSDNNLPI